MSESDFHNFAPLIKKDSFYVLLSQSLQYFFSTSVAKSAILHPLAKNLRFERAKGEGTFPKSLGSTEGRGFYNSTRSNRI